MSKPAEPKTAPVSNRERVQSERASALKISPKSRLAQLLVNPDVTKAVFAAKEPLYHLLLAYQQSIVAPSNATEVGHTVLAISSVQEFLDQIAEFGREDAKLKSNQNDPND